MISKLEEFKTYNLAIEIGEDVWNIVRNWDSFARDTIGKQLVKASDSIAANLAEGLGRYHFKETKNFSYYSRGSLFETKTWLAKSANRQLVDTATADKLQTKLEQLGKMINSYINSLGTLGEPPLEYNGDNLNDNFNTSIE